MIGSTTLKIIIQAKDEASKVIKRTTAQLNKTKISNDELARSAGRTGMVMTGMAAVIGGLAVKAAMNLEQAVANAVSVTGKFGVEAEEAKKKVSALAQVLGQETAFTATDAAEALYDLASKGRDVANMTKEDLLPFLDLAAATQSDLATTTQMVNEAINQMGLTIKDSGRVADVFAKAIGSSSLKMDNLGDAMTYAGPVAAGFGLTLEKTVAIVGKLADAGFKGSMAGTALRGALVRLSNVTGAAKSALSEMGLTVNDVNPAMNDFTEILRTLSESGMTATQAMTIFGQRAGPGMMALIKGGADAIDELNDKLLDADGVARKMATDQLNTLAGQMMLLKSSTEGVLIALGEMLIPAITRAASKAMNWINANKQLATTIAKVLLIVLGIVGPLLLLLSVFLKAGKVIATVIGILGKFGKAILMMGKAMIWLVTNPLGWIILAIAAVAVAVYLIVKHWSKIKEFIINVWTSIKNFLSRIWDNIKKTATTVWNGIVAFFKGVLNAILLPYKIVFTLMVGILETALNAMGTSIKEVFTAIKDFFVSIWNSIKDYFASQLETIKNILLTFGEFFLKIWTFIWDSIRESFEKRWNAIKKILESIISFIKGVWTRGKEVLLAAWLAIWEPIKSATTKVIDEIKSPIEAVVNWISEKFAWISEKVGGIGRSVGGFFKGAYETGQQILGTRQAGGSISQTGLYKLHAGEYVVPKNRFAASGVGNIAVYIQGGSYLSEDAAEQMGDIIISKLKDNIRI